MIALATGCSGTSAPSAPPPAPVLADAGLAMPGPSVAVAAEDVPPPIPRDAKRTGRPIEIVLRSSPPHSLVAVDGVQLGITPQVWAGTTGSEHEFTFVLKQHAVARYRFVPITSGVVHARLEAIVDDTPGAATSPGTIVPRDLAHPPATAPTVVPPASPIVDRPPASDVTAVPIDAAAPTPPAPTTGAGPQP